MCPLHSHPQGSTGSSTFLLSIESPCFFSFCKISFRQGGMKTTKSYLKIKVVCAHCILTPRAQPEVVLFCCQLKAHVFSHFAKSFRQGGMKTTKSYLKIKVVCAHCILIPQGSTGSSTFLLSIESPCFFSF